MSAYRLYFLNEAGNILSAEVFDAPDHAIASTIAVNLADACRDECSGFELWQRDSRLLSQFPFDGPPPPINDGLEEAVIQLEERIRDSEKSIARSERLLKRIGQLKNGQISG